MSLSQPEILKNSLKQIFQTLNRHLFSMILQVALVILIARLLGPEAQGSYAIGVFWAYFLSTFLALGINHANIYFYNVRGAPLSRLLKLNLMIWGVGSFSGFVLGGSIVIFAGASLFPNIETNLLFLALPIFSLMTLNGYLSSFFQATQTFGPYNLIALIRALSQLISLLYLLIYVSAEAYLALIAFGFAEICALIMSVLFLIQLLQSQQETVVQTKIKLQLREFLLYGFKSYLSNVLAFLHNRSNLFLVNFMLSAQAAGIFSIALQMAERIWMLSEAVGVVIFPKQAQMQSKGNLSTEITLFSARWIFLISCLASMLLLIIIWFSITLVLGQAYQPTILPFCFLLPGIIAIAPARLIAQDISARGYPELNYQVASIGLIINIIGNLILIPILGLLGAALATSAARLFVLFWRLIRYKKLARVNWLQFVQQNTFDALLLQQLSLFPSRLKSFYKGS